MILRGLFLFSLILTFYSSPSFAEGSESSEKLLSPPILAVDIDGDGIDIIPLEKSNVYFDMDGDGLVERTAWIGPDDGIISVNTKLGESFDRVYSTLTAQAANIFNVIERVPPKEIERSGGVIRYVGISPNEMGGPDYPRPRIDAYQDSDSNGLIYNEYSIDGPNGPDTSRCEGIRIFYGLDGTSYFDCYQHNRFPVQEVRLEYEDSNLPWNDFCKKYPFGHYADFLRNLKEEEYKESPNKKIQFLRRYSNIIKCLDQGYRPGVSGRYKQEDHKVILEEALKALKEYKPTELSEFIK